MREAENGYSMDKVRESGRASGGPSSSARTVEDGKDPMRCDAFPLSRRAQSSHHERPLFVRGLASPAEQ
jgi:hypothetical protein